MVIISKSHKNATTDTYLLRSNPIVLLGAAVTVLMAAFMTSTQQAVAATQKQTPVDPIARLPRALQYSYPDTGGVVWDKLAGGYERSKIYHQYPQEQIAD